MTNRLEPFVEQQINELNDSMAMILASSDRLGTIIMIVSITSIILGILIAWSITRSITKPLNYAIEGLTTGSEQASLLEETSSSLEEMAGMTQQNASNAEESSSASQELAAQAQQMQVIVEDLSRVVNGAKATTMTKTTQTHAEHHTPAHYTKGTPTAYSRNDIN